MPSTIETILRAVNRELAPQFEEKLRGYLQHQSKEWLIEQVVRLSLDAHSLKDKDRTHFQQAKERSRAERRKRVEILALNETKLKAFLKKYPTVHRDQLIQEGYLTAEAPKKGLGMIRERHRTKKGEKLLLLAKDVLFALLFGDDSNNTQFQRIQRELLTMVLPSFKAHALDFMQATTEISGLGTWQDPDSVSNDARADNIILEVEFGEIKGEWIGQGIARALSIINNLEVNEQILYARMENVEQSTLIE